MQFNYSRLLIAGGCALAVVGLLYWGFVQAFQTQTPFHYSDSKSDDKLLRDVYNSTLGFQKIFVINLPARFDHRDSMSLAASLTGIEVDYIDGATGVSRDLLPPGGFEKHLKDGGLGAWRAHMNVLRTIVEQNITSALVMEDDVDWDLRIKSQMRDFAKASRLLVQPLRGTSDRFLDPSYPHPLPNQKPEDIYIGKQATTTPTTSPYGDLDRWDLLWLGHCGCSFPRAKDKSALPIGRAVILDDETVPETQHINFQAGTQVLMKHYPNHTRIVSRAHLNLCSLAYGITQAGAQRFLYEVGVHKMDRPTDLGFQDVCDGRRDRRQAMCLTVQPQLFNHHRPVAKKSTFSDIQPGGGGFNKVAYTKNVRWSTRLNFGKLLDGETDYVDLFEDGEPTRTDVHFG